MPKHQATPKRRMYRITVCEGCVILLPLTDRGASDMAKMGWQVESVA